jgi:hypothetical protein
VCARAGRGDEEISGAHANGAQRDAVRGGPVDAEIAADLRGDVCEERETSADGLSSCCCRGDSFVTGASRALGRPSC